MIPNKCSAINILKCICLYKNRNDMSYRIFVINPGSTSTKLAYFEDGNKLYEANVFHDAPVLAKFASAYDQLDFRKQMILQFLDENGIDLHGVDAVVGRGGSTATIRSGVYEINDKLWALMLDSTLCAYNEEAGLNTVGGVIWEETIEWLRPYLEEAKNKGIQVIGFSHHNLAEHNPMFNNNYVMFDADKLAALYEEYNIRLHFSGHMHIQNIAKTGNIYDIAQGSLLDYGNKVGILEVFDNCMEYTREQVGDFEEYSLGVFSNKYLSRNTSAYEKKYCLIRIIK